MTAPSTMSTILIGFDIVSSGFLLAGAHHP
jgi:hypothetical protein